MRDSAVDSEIRLRGEMEELRHSLLSTLLVVVPILSWCWFLAVLLRRREVGAENVPPALLGLGMILVYKLRRRHHDLACWAFLLLAVLVEGLLVARYPASRATAFGVLAIVVANALLGSRQALVTALAMWAGVTVSSQLAARRTDSLDVLLLYILTWAATWLAARPLRTSMIWALSGWQRATDALAETRERRAEVYHALRALEEATYRIERMNSELIVARREAEEARALKARFAAAVSHELRGPLSLILGFSQMIALSPERYGVPLPAPYQPDVDTIYRNSQHLVALVDDILDLSRIEAERLPLVKDRVELEEDVVRKVANIIEPLARRKGLTFHLELAGNLPWILADPVRLRQALLNLATNAVRFTEKGGVTVHTRQEAQSVIVSVHDTGPGIAAEEVRKLFQEFYQVHTAETREQVGSGLGLSISKHLIELHGGQIWADSTPGTGTSFHFSLPLPGTEGTAGGLARTEPARHQFATESCLIVHEDPGIVRLLARYIEDYRMVGLPDGADVVALTEDLHPRAIITTPEREEGIRRALAPTAFDVPIVTCALPRLTEWANIRGASSYLIKPITTDVVMAVMRRLERNGETTVLLVDDDPDAVRLLERMLTGVPRPYTILKAYDGLEALDLMREVAPDVVFMDLLMPGLDGRQVIDRMHDDERLRAVQVVIVSARDWLEGEAAVDTPISVRSRAPVEIARAARCLKALLDTLGPSYLAEPTLPAGSPAAYPP